MYGVCGIATLLVYASLAPCLSGDGIPASKTAMSIDNSQCICNLICVYAIRFAVSVVKDLKRLSPYHRNVILDAIETQLSHQPTSPAKHRKLLMNLIPPWDAVPPVWELRVGEFRVLYDVSKTERTVHVRAIRKKPSEKRTEEIL
jgi:mRNA-degrading endonuclease RelE of RelBE toxin-antitoxin system